MGTPRGIGTSSCVLGVRVLKALQRGFEGDPGRGQVRELRADLEWPRARYVEA